MQMGLDAWVQSNLFTSELNIYMEMVTVYLLLFICYWYKFGLGLGLNKVLQRDASHSVLSESNVSFC